LHRGYSASFAQAGRLTPDGSRRARTRDASVGGHGGPKFPSHDRPNASERRFRDGELKRRGRDHLLVLFLFLPSRVIWARVVWSGQQGYALVRLSYLALFIGRPSAGAGPCVSAWIKRSDAVMSALQGVFFFFFFFCRGFFFFVPRAPKREFVTPVSLIIKCRYLFER